MRVTTRRHLANRQHNKSAIEAGFGLTPGDGPLFTVISRLTWQKGMDVLADQLDTLVSLGGRLALLGTGEAALQARFRAAASRHPGKIGVAIGYDEKLSHLLQGGADAILIPSRFEPCGLTQLYGLAYGCVPVAARTGGLGDTIIDANEAALASGVATGILFDEVTADSLAHALRRAMSLYAQTDVWHGMQQQGMRADFSWQRSGARYAELYARVIGSRRRRAFRRTGMSPSLGAHLVAGGTQFAVRARDAMRVDLCLFDGREDARADGAPDDMHVADRRQRQSRASAMAFAPMATGIPDKGISSMPAKLLVDPYAKLLDRRFRYDPGLCDARRGYRPAGAQGHCLRPPRR